MNTGIKLDYFGGYAPIQAWGEVEGQKFYFRARWDEWQFEIGKPGIEVPTTDKTQLLFVREGELLPNAFYNEMAAIIISCFQEYLVKTKNPQTTRLLSDLNTKLQAIIHKDISNKSAPI